MCRSNSWRVRCLHRVFGLFVGSIILTSCQHLGPWALEQGRERYNEKIHLTSRDQLFANMIRVANNETPFFMDVSEVDAAELIQGTVSGGETGLGAHAGLMGIGPAVTFPNGSGAISGSEISAHSGAVAGSVAYQESPTIRYFPLSGQALVAQIATPISVTSIANLFSSDWQFLSLLDLSLDRMTPNFQDFYAALNAIVEIDRYGALVVAATKSDATKPEAAKPERIDGTNFTIQTTAPQQQATDSLTLYLQPDHPDLTALDVNAQNRVVEKVQCDGQNYSATLYNEAVTDETTKLLLAKRNIMHLWIRLLRLYASTQAGAIWQQYQNPQADNKLSDLDEKLGDSGFSALDKIVEELPKKIELRSSAVPTRKEQPSSSKSATGSRKAAGGSNAENLAPPNKAPIIQTHSALGILLYALHEYAIEFLTLEAYDAIRAHPWNGLGQRDFYTLLTSDENSLCSSGLGPCYNHWADTREQECVSNWIKDHPENYHVTFSIKTNVAEYPAINAEFQLGNLRRLLLIIVTDSAPPSDAFVSYRAYGKTFYIDGNDVISRKNFALLAQFMTMQAIPPTTAPLTPTISVGAGG